MVFKTRIFVLAHAVCHLHTGDIHGNVKVYLGAWLRFTPGTTVDPATYLQLPQ